MHGPLQPKRIGEAAIRGIYRPTGETVVIVSNNPRPADPGRSIEVRFDDGRQRWVMQYQLDLLASHR